MNKRKDFGAYDTDVGIGKGSILSPILSFLHFILLPLFVLFSKKFIDLFSKM